MKTVWVLFEDYYAVAEQSFVGVFSTHKAALKYIETHLLEDGETFSASNWYLQEVPLDDRANLD